MTAGRLQRIASFGLAVTWGLLAVSLFSGCSWHREYVRRGAMLDSLAARTDRIETQQTDQAEWQQELRADLLTDLEALMSKLNQLEARALDQEQRVARIGRKLGVWYGDATPPDTAVQPGSTAAVPDSVAVAIDPDQLYATAYLDFTRGKYQVAIAGFKQYLQMFPASDLSDNAQYWIGECHHSNGELVQAEEEFKRVLTDHPEGNKVPAAEYKLGLVYRAQNREDDARRQFAAVVEKYPGTTEARLAQDRLLPQQ